MDNRLKILSLCLFLLLGLTNVSGQTPGAYTSTHSYRVEHTYLDPSSTSSCIRATTDITYLDGFSRPLQLISVNATPDGLGDLIQPYNYGTGGRVDCQYLPYARVGNNGALITAPLSPSNWSIYGATDQAFAFSQTAYDGSPLDRVTQHTGPGSAWHTGGHSQTISYGQNSAGEVRLYRLTPDGSLLRDGDYPAGSLQKQTTTDEDGKTTITYTDNQDRILLSACINSPARLETYNVYNDRGLLVWVLSPEATFHLGDGTDPSILSRLAYRYDYDLRGRLLTKTLPGCAPIHYVYDGKDRLILSQDGKQRTSGLWSYTLYDSNNRPIESGETTLPGETHTGLQSETASSTNYIPPFARTALQYTVYDTYTASPVSPAHPFASTPGYSVTHHPHVAGLTTSVSTRLLGTSTWYTQTFYYDRNSRLIQTVSDNRLGGISRTACKYDLTGRLLSRREIHGKSVGSPDILETITTYDTRDRITATTIKLNAGVTAEICYAHDPLGRTVSTLYGSNYFTNYTYNIRNWLTSSSSPEFCMKLRYGTPEGDTPASYNGNISGLEWQQGTDSPLQYGFTYDGANRLLNSQQKIKNTSIWEPNPTSYTEQGLSYDRNGNLQTLQRTGGGTLLDNLTYTYVGNQLSSLDETVSDGLAGDIYLRGSSSTGTYTYDNNGNLINDSRRALQFHYNSLNLISDIRSGDLLKAGYVYLSDGTKLGVIDGTGTSGFEYVGSLIYRRDGGILHLSEALFGDGLIRVGTDGGQEVNYFLKDHLGSIRVVIDANGQVKERNDYYPFGGVHQRGDYAASSNRYKYNGKEEQTTGGVGYLDYGARMYDAGLGRWFGVDPLGEKYHHQSSYTYCNNNPILFIDPDGMEVRRTQDGSISITGDDLYRYWANLLLVSEGKTPWDNFNQALDMAADSDEHRFLNLGETTYITGSSSLRYLMGEKQDFTGFWGTFEFILTGGHIGGVEYNYDGYIIGMSPCMGIAPTPGMKDGGFLKAGKAASKGLPHGDAGRALNKVESQIKTLEEQFKTATGSTKRIILKKIENIKKIAQKKAKGETHWRK